MCQHFRLFAFAVALALLFAAVPPLALAQTYALEVYTNPNFGGSLCLSNAPETANIHTSCNDQISSIRLKAGWSVRVHPNQGQGGSSVCFNRSDTDLANNTFEDGSAANDAISSFSLYNQAWCGGTPTPAYPLEVYNDPGYGGLQCYSWHAETANIYVDCDNQISSVLLRAGWTMRVYSDQNQGGSRGCLTSREDNLADNSFFDGVPMNDAISSFVLYSQGNCGNVAPNIPALSGPTNGSTLNNRTVTLSWFDPGDPDNWPRTYRDYYAEVRKSDNSWSTTLNWQTATSWTLTVPGDGTYVWRAQSGDGMACSGWSSERSFTVGQTPPPQDHILNVRYVDQVFAQRTPLDGWWVYCEPSSLAMMLNYYGVEKRDVFANRAATVDLAREMRVDIHGTPGGAIPAALRSRSLTYTLGNGAISAAAIKSSIDNGHPVLISLKSYNHILLIVGYRTNGNFVVHDPFGGRFWPTKWSSTANRNDAPWKVPFDTPRIKGATLPAQNQYIEYSYGELTGMGFGWTLRVTGVAQPLQSATVQVNPANGVFTGQQIQIRFGQPAVAALSTSAPISVTYTPRFTSERPTSAYAGTLAAFRLAATDSDNHPLAALDALFTIELTLDPNYADDWIGGGGVIGGESQISPSSPSESRPMTQSLVLAAWDAGQGAWIELPTTIDPSTKKAIALSARFGDYALLVRPNPNIIYLPLARR